MDAIAARCPAPLPVATDGELEERLLLLMSALPRQTAGDIDGALKIEAYLLVLRSRQMPAAQLDFMTRRALETCRWMPAPAQLLELAAEWTRNDEAVQACARAGALAWRERERRLDDARRALIRGELDQAGIDALPQRFVDIFETQGLLRREVTEDGARYTARPQPKLPDADKAPADISELRQRLDARFASQRGDA